MVCLVKKDVNVPEVRTLVDYSVVVLPRLVHNVHLPTQNHVEVITLFKRLDNRWLLDLRVFKVIVFKIILLFACIVPEVTYTN